MTRSKFFPIAALVASATPTWSACAMTAPSAASIHCTIIGAENLPAQLGGEKAICSAIAAAAAAPLEKANVAPSAVSVTVAVKSESRISAVPTVNGKALDEQNVATSDRPLTANAIRMLADAVARTISASVGVGK